MEEEEKVEEQASETTSDGSGFNFGTLLVIILGIGLVLGVVYFLFAGRNGVDETEIPGVAEELEEEYEEAVSDVVTYYSMDEVSFHSTPEDCWLVIDGRVYDATMFIADAAHPGGEALLEGCGLDATELFETRPMGSGTPHSSSARVLLDGFYIGEISTNLEGGFVDEFEDLYREESGGEVGL